MKMEANIAFFFLTGQIESNYDEVTDSFDSMDLKPELLRGMYPLRLIRWGRKKIY